VPRGGWPVPRGGWPVPRGGRGASWRGPIGMVDRMRLPFPRVDTGFYELFTRSARNLVTGTAVLAEPALPGVDVHSVSALATALEHDSDQITHEIYNKINSARRAPFDRADIYQLSSNLDDVMDHIEAAGTLVYLYGLTKLPALPREIHELIDAISQQAELTAAAMPRLRTGQELRDYWIECNRLENEGDRAYRM